MQKTGSIFHDRFIVLDYGTADERVFLCGASSKDAGKLLISIIAAVAEMESENIRVQTMAEREQKVREGKWNGGFVPYGYKLDNGQLVIAEDEVDIIQLIFDRYIHTNNGINGVANYLNNHGYTKKLRHNGTTPGFSSSFIKKIIDNPVYMGKIAYGRRRTEKKNGTRNETHVVEKFLILNSLKSTM